MSVARLVYSQARMIGYGADDPGLFCAGMFHEHFYLDGNQKIKFLLYLCSCNSSLKMKPSLSSYGSK